MPRRWAPNDPFYGQYQTILFDLESDIPEPQVLTLNGEPIVLNGFEIALTPES